MIKLLWGELYLRRIDFRVYGHQFVHCLAGGDADVAAEEFPVVAGRQCVVDANYLHHKVQFLAEVESWLCAFFSQSLHHSLTSP